MRHFVWKETREHNIEASLNDKALSGWFPYKIIPEFADIPQGGRMVCAYVVIWRRRHIQYEEELLHRAREIATQAWCVEENKHTVMDPNLVEAFAHILLKWM